MCPFSVPKQSTRRSSRCSPGNLSTPFPFPPTITRTKSSTLIRTWHRSPGGRQVFPYSSVGRSTTVLPRRTPYRMPTLPSAPNPCSSIPNGLRRCARAKYCRFIHRKRRTSLTQIPHSHDYQETLVPPDCCITCNENNLKDLQKKF